MIILHDLVKHRLVDHLGTVAEIDQVIIKEEILDKINTFLLLSDQRNKIISDYDIGVVRDGKIILMMNVIDMDLLQEVMVSEDMQAWDKKHNCVDVIYSLEEQS